MAGGLYDQHPLLLEQWEIIFRAKAEHEKRKAAEQSRKLGQKKASGGRGRGRRR